MRWVSPRCRIAVLNTRDCFWCHYACDKDLRKIKWFPFKSRGWLAKKDKEIAFVRLVKHIHLSRTLRIRNTIFSIVEDDFPVSLLLLPYLTKPSPTATNKSLDGKTFCHLDFSGRIRLVLPSRLLLVAFLFYKWTRQAITSLGEVCEKLFKKSGRPCA